MLNLNWLRRRREQAELADRRRQLLHKVTDQMEEINKRHWDGANNDDPEKVAQWCQADGRHINSILVDNLETVRNRSQYEARVNSTVEGVIETHKSDVVGRDGPSLQVESGDQSWNEQAEAVWREEFWTHCDSTGQLSGGDYLKQAVEQWWTSGNLLSQIIFDRDTETRLQTKLHAIDSARLRSPMDGIANPNILLGVERNKLGRAKAYHIADQDFSQLGYGVGVATEWGKTKRIVSRDMI
ncbi:MAG: phage portal protein, partial [Planctomycetota bacterium]